MRHEKEKRRRYEQRVKDVEGATFVPLVFSTAGGMGRSSSVTFKRIAALLAEKTGLSYAATINVVRCRLSFALLRSAITALRGSRRRRVLRGVCRLLANPPFAKKKKKKKRSLRFDRARYEALRRKHFTLLNPVRSSESQTLELQLQLHAGLPLGRGTGAWYRGTHRAHTNGFVECRGRSRRQVSFQQQTSSLCVREKLNFLVSAKISRKRPTAQPSIFESFAQAAKRRTTLGEDDQPNVVVVVDDDPSSDITEVG